MSLNEAESGTQAASPAQDFPSGLTHLQAVCAKYCQHPALFGDVETICNAPVCVSHETKKRKLWPRGRVEEESPLATSENT